LVPVGLLSVLGEQSTAYGVTGACQVCTAVSCGSLALQLPLPSVSANALIVIWPGWSEASPTTMTLSPLPSANVVSQPTTLPAVRLPELADAVQVVVPGPSDVEPAVSSGATSALVNVGWLSLSCCGSQKPIVIDDGVWSPVALGSESAGTGWVSSTVIDPPEEPPWVVSATA
jgi:hypothetical protein